MDPVEYQPCLPVQVEELLTVAEVDGGWKVDPVLRQACAPVARQACSDADSSEWVITGRDKRSLQGVLRHQLSDEVLMFGSIPGAFTYLSEPQAGMLLHYACYPINKHWSACITVTLCPSADNGLMCPRAYLCCRAKAKPIMLLFSGDKHFTGEPFKVFGHCHSHNITINLKPISIESSEKVVYYM